ncbi:cyclic nucleotide-binding domain-containing protein [Limoniibacter endophyticus]|uniref:Cyclic nucleotide-binding protein n=1 Tax=Limoniibacter endophyticus TaxID=1565040 RepID=A0A8J3DJN3_9HYPH|nr:cyclic nucleotide-binding domain-containing protein [Limoniibacter endophyticus]GHC73983.1 cyclic nucleotide-binding protein [Limoniibacter endophyticus]
MGLEEDIFLLRKIELFASFDNEPLRLLAFGAEKMQLKRGTTLFQEGDTSDSAYLVMHGGIDLMRAHGDQEFTVESVSSGALIDEMALITRMTRSASAITRTNCELMRIGRSQFRRILEEYPQLAANLHEVITRRFQEMVARMSEVQSRLGDD